MSTATAKAAVARPATSITIKDIGLADTVRYMTSREQEKGVLLDAKMRKQSQKGYQNKCRESNSVECAENAKKGEYCRSDDLRCSLRWC